VRPRDLVQMELDVPAHRIQAPADSAPKPPRERLAMFWATLLPSETTRKLPGGRDGPLLPTLIGE